MRGHTGPLPDKQLLYCSNMLHLCHSHLWPENKIQLLCTSLFFWMHYFPVNGASNISMCSSVLTWSQLEYSDFLQPPLRWLTFASGLSKPVSAQNSISSQKIQLWTRLWHTYKKSLAPSNYISSQISPLG